MRRIYFSGINGIGMSGIAKILKQQGNIVEGSDLEYKDITKSLEDLGIKVHIGPVSYTHLTLPTTPYV